MSPRRRRATNNAPTEDDAHSDAQNFCYGLLSGHHPYDEKKPILIPRDDGAMEVRFKCRSCTMGRNTVYARGKKNVHHYDEPPGYARPGKKNITTKRVEAREAYFANNKPTRTAKG